VSAVVQDVSATAGGPVVARRIRRVGSNLYHNSAVLVLVQSPLGHYAHRTLARRPSWTMSANRVLKCHDNEICLAGTLDCTWLYALEGLAFSHASGAEGQRITVLPGPLDHSSCGGSGRAVQSQSHRPIGAAGRSRARSSPAHKSLSTGVGTQEGIMDRHDTSSRGSHRAVEQPNKEVRYG